MTDINDMKKALDTLVTSSKLDQLFKLGKLRIQETKLPHSIGYRLKLHNPYTFLEFTLADKKNGLKFGIHHLKTIPKELRTFLLELGGSPNNSSTLIEFPYDGEEGHIPETLKKVFKELVTPSMIRLCKAENYKPLKLLQTKD